MVSGVLEAERSYRRYALANANIHSISPPLLPPSHPRPNECLAKTIDGSSLHKFRRSLLTPKSRRRTLTQSEWDEDIANTEIRGLRCQVQQSATGKYKMLMLLRPGLRISMNRLRVVLKAKVVEGYEPYFAVGEV